MKANQVATNIKLVRVEPGRYRTSDGRFDIKKVLCGREQYESNYLWRVTYTDKRLKFRSSDPFHQYCGGVRDDFSVPRMPHVVDALRKFYRNEDAFDIHRHTRNHLGY